MREAFGSYPLQCYDVIMASLSQVTKNALKQKTSVPILLRRTCDNPFAKWGVSQVESRR